MTCIVGIVRDGAVYMGGDSAATSGWDLTVKRSPKIFRKGNMLLGVTGYTRLTQILQYLFELPAHPDHVSTEEYMVAYFVEAMREACKDGGYARKDMEQERHESTLLVGYQGQLFEVESNYQVTDADREYYAVGCGAPYALGVLYATKNLLFIDPQIRIQQALEAAEYFSGGVRGPFAYATLEASNRIAGDAAS